MFPAFMGDMSLASIVMLTTRFVASQYVPSIYMDYMGLKLVCPVALSFMFTLQLGIIIIKENKRSSMANKVESFKTCYPFKWTPIHKVDCNT